jgi:hypothetical protein
MQEIVEKSRQANSLNYEDLPLEDKQRLVDAFAWLIQEDKKQNPDLYQPKKETI